ncbi:MAG: hypothetical protein NXI31_25025 [bacterium]|nr:hypothetical protein [bacterium]
MTGDHHDDDYDDDFLDDFALDDGAGPAGDDTGAGDSDEAADGPIDFDPEVPSADESGDGSDGFDVSPDFDVAGPGSDFDDVVAAESADAADDLGDDDLPMPTDEDLPTLEEFALEDPFDNEAAESLGEELPGDGASADEPSADEPSADEAAPADPAMAGPSFDDDPLFGSSPAPGDEASAPDGPDEDDMLFEDHTQGIEASETFVRKQQFDEGNESDWQGEQLELDSEDGFPVAGTPSEPAALESGIPMDDEAGTPVELGATAEFVGDDRPLDAELDSLLEEDEFALDSEGELEIVGGDTVAGTPVPEQPAEHAAEIETIGEPEPAFEDSALGDQGGDEISLAGEEAFVIEDNDWQEVELGAPAALPADDVEGASADVAPEVLEPASLSADLEAVGEDVEPALGDAGETSAEDYEFIGSLSEAANAESAGQAEGWEPLPGTRMDELAEVDGVETVDDEAAGGDSYAPAPQLQAVATADASEHDELYADADGDEDPEVVGGYQERHKLFGMLTAVAALLFVGLGATIAILRPELIGLRFAPEKVEVVQLPRPRVDLEIAAPPLPATGLEGPDVGVAEPPKVTSGDPAPNGGDPTPGGTDPNGTDPNGADPNGADPSGSDPNVSEPSGGEPNGHETGAPTGVDPDPAGTDPRTAGPAGQDPSTGVPGTGAPVAGDPVGGPGAGLPAAGDPGADSPTVGDPTASSGDPTAGGEGESTPVAIAPSATGDTDTQENWPVTVLQGPEKPPSTPKEELVAMGDNLLAGPQNEPTSRQAADGVLPGSRAFAQLDNGNYFIGSVKAVNTRFLTLRLRDGEISLARDSIVKLTGLGSADFEELQRATSGFIRLTNNNRLVGSILEGIRDDHVILQTRSNRVMLPKSVVGKIVEQANESGVRIGTTNEEDAWLRRLSEQQLKGGDLRAATPKPDGGSGR